MEESFWRGAWSDNRIGFHRSEVNPLLLRYGERIAPSSRVLVPLAGKSVDLTWLAEQGHEVVAVELVESALVAYFEERGVEYVRRDDGALVGGGVEAWPKNIFDLGPAQLGRFDLVYDRAALVALRPDDRERYAALLAALIRPRGKLLLVTLDYDPSKMSGPPHSVSPAEVEALFSSFGTITELERASIIESEPRFAARGLDWMTQAVFEIVASDS